MRIDKNVRAFIEYQLRRFEFNKIELQLYRDFILDAAGGNMSDYNKNNRGGSMTDRTAVAVIMLNESEPVYYLQKNILTVEKILFGLPEEQRMLFKKVYCEGRRDIYKICDELFISERTFKRYKSKIICRALLEFGFTVGRDGAMINTDPYWSKALKKHSENRKNFLVK